jgi:P27 family predicted phage terminase small subunit
VPLERPHNSGPFGIMRDDVNGINMRSMRLIGGDTSHRPARVEIQSLGGPLKPAYIADHPPYSYQWDLAVAAMPDGTYTQSDTAALSIYAVSVVEFEELTKQLLEFGYVSRTSDGSTKGNPIAAAWSAAADKALKCGDKLGLSPAARAKMGTPDPNAKKKNKFQGLMD